MFNRLTGKYFSFNFEGPLTHSACWGKTSLGMSYVSEDALRGNSIDELSTKAIATATTQNSKTERYKGILISHDETKS